MKQKTLGINMRYRSAYREKSKKPTKIDLKINIENFGPITKAKINLKPLTIFVGPNNSGKTYAATLIHSILSSENQINDISRQYDLEILNPSRLFRSFGKDMRAIIEKDVRAVIKKNKNKQSFTIPTSITKKIFTFLIQDVFGRDLETTIASNFASPVTELIRTKQKSSKININDSKNFNVTINKKLTIKTDSKLTKYIFKISPKETDYYYTEQEENNTTTITINKSDVEEFLNYGITRYLINSIAKNIKHEHIPEDSHYFPAARSGILQGHKALSASIVKSAHFGGIESFQIPKLTGIVSNFISNIILMPRRLGPFADLAKQLETELLHGHIRLPNGSNDTFPEITYHTKHNEIPLHRTSSSISEIAPLSLYLKHIIHPSSLLIIEEPETHLHPTNQLIFAKYIVKMIRSGLNVLVTTHSVFLLEQLSKFMLVSRIEPKTRKKLGYDEEDYLTPDEVSPYVFVRNNDDDHTVSPIEIDDEGISQEEFVKVNEILYSESIKLQQNLDG